jgi:ribosomal protein S18 acetylase RimI-like enzyme
MAISVRPVPLEDIVTAEFRETAEDAVDLSEAFLAFDGSNEIGLLLVDHRPELDELHIHEVRVIPSHENSGVATALLRTADSIARERGYRRITLQARPLSASVDRERLFALYARAGYSATDDGPEYMAKEIRRD